MYCCPMPINRWDHKLQLGDVFHNEDMTFEQRRDEIVRRIKAAKFYDEDDHLLVDIVESLECSGSDMGEFDYFWNEFYDYCDDRRIWVETIRTRANA